MGDGRRFRYVRPIAQFNVPARKLLQPKGLAQLKEIDLGPNGYRKQVKGRWQLPNHPKLARNMLFVVIAVVGFILWTADRSALSTAGAAAMFSFVAGTMFALWFRD